LPLFVQKSELALLLSFKAVFYPPKIAIKLFWAQNLASKPVYVLKKCKKRFFALHRLEDTHRVFKKFHNGHETRCVSFKKRLFEWDLFCGAKLPIAPTKKVKSAKFLCKTSFFGINLRPRAQKV